MPATSKALALAAALSGVNAYRGFNYGATFTTGAIKQQSDYEAEFKAAKELPGTDGAFDSARIYTMIQGDTANDPISAIPAAIKTKTSLLFGLWASAGDESFNNEIAALQKTIDQYCEQLDGLVAGISVGSEDLYRNSPTGIENGEYAGANPDTLVGYIDRVRDTVKGSCLGDAPIGHVDTWTAYANSSNNALIEACDWLGMDAYAYFESTKPNSIGNGKQLFDDALAATKANAHGKPVWITETGWPVSGKDFGEAIASKDNARTFYKEVGCPEFGSTNVWWYTLLDAAPDTPNPSFGVISELGGEPLYDLSCDGASEPSPSASASVPPSVSPSSDPVSSTEAGDAEPTTTSSHQEDHETSTVTQTDNWPPTQPVPSDTSVDGPIPSMSTLPTVPSDDTTQTASVPADEPTTPQPQPTESPAPVPVPEPSEQPGDNEPVESTPAQTTPGSPPTETPPLPAAGAKLNSFGAAAAAVLLAIGMM